MLSPMKSKMSTTPHIHHGKNVRRFRELLGVKPEDIAYKLGEGWNQEQVFLIENQKKIDTSVLQQFADALQIPVEAIQNFIEIQPTNIIGNNFGDNAFVGNMNSTFNINPLDELKKLHEEKIALYERMLKEKDEMMIKFESLLKK